MPEDLDRDSLEELLFAYSDYVISATNKPVGIYEYIDCIYKGS